MEHSSVNSGWHAFPPAWEPGALAPLVDSLLCLALCLRPGGSLSFLHGAINLVSLWMATGLWTNPT